MAEGLAPALSLLTPAQRRADAMGAKHGVWCLVACVCGLAQRLSADPCASCCKLRIGILKA